MRCPGFACLLHASPEKSHTRLYSTNCNKDHGKMVKLNCAVAGTVNGSASNQSLRWTWTFKKIAASLDFNFGESLFNSYALLKIIFPLYQTGIWYLGAFSYYSLSQQVSFFSNNRNLVWITVRYSPPHHLNDISYFYIVSFWKTTFWISIDLVFPKFK